MKISLLKPSGLLQRKQASKKWGCCWNLVVSEYFLPPANLGDDIEDEDEDDMEERLVRLLFLCKEV